MNRRQSIANGYQVPAGMKLVPATPPQIPYMNGSVQSYQPIPMASQALNRVAPPRSDYNPYLQPNHSFRTHSSMTSTRPLVQPSERYGQYPHQQDRNDQGLNDVSSSWFSKPLCLGLTRLSGGILFGTIALLAAGALAGLIVAVVLYVQDNTTDGQWKILGMVVCGIMLLTIFITLCIFFYCYKTGHIIGGGANSNNNNNHSSATAYNQEDDGRNPYHYNSSYDHAPSSYGINSNASPYFNTHDDVIQVQDKQTNTEVTMCPLRPRDIQRGVWTPRNVYGGISYRPLQPTRTVDRFIQVHQNDIDHTLAQQKNHFVPRTVVRQSGTRLASPEEQFPQRLNRTQPQYGIVEEIIERPRGQQSNDFAELSQNKRRGSNNQKYSKVLVTRIRTIEDPPIEDDNRTTDHFYQ